MRALWPLGGGLKTRNTELGSSVNPQARMPALPCSADISVRGFWRHPCRQVRSFRQALSFLCTLLLLGYCQVSLGATEDSFARGLTEYQAGHFAEAAKAFREAPERRPASGTLLNLGLTEWRRGRPGPAILAWEQVQWISPFDAQAKANLDYARQFTGVEAPDLTWYERASTWLPANAWTWLAGLALWLAIGLAVLPGVLRWRRANWQQGVAALSFAVFLLSLPAHVGVVTRTRIGFVLKKDAPLRLTPTAEAESQVKLNAGEPVRAMRVRGDYVLVRTAQGQGWIERAQFGRICAN